MMYPAMLNIRKKRITIIGGGKVAYRKAKTFLNFGADVWVVASCLDTQFKQIEDKLHIECLHVEEKHLKDKLQDSFIVVAATNERAFNEVIGSYCEKAQILCNVVDNSALSSFIVPAYIKRGDLVIGISTNGKSPSLAKKIKKELEEKYDDSFLEYVDILGRIREHVVGRVEDKEEKKRILQHLITLDLEALRDYEKSYFNH